MPPRSNPHQSASHAPHWVISCEHASAHVPRKLRSCLSSAEAQDALKSHRGCDWGARAVARHLAKVSHVSCIEGTMTRLLVDLNRSPGHAHQFSIWSRRLDEETRAELLDHYQRHQQTLIDAIESVPPQGLVHHLAVHSFTPVYQGRVRRTDIGLLYDPERTAELAWVARLRARLQANSTLRIHRNLPYRGTSDGLTQIFRTRWRNTRYAGLELEINQALLDSPSKIRVMQRLLADALFS